MIKTIINTFWQSTIINGEDFLRLDAKKNDRVKFVTHLFYFLVFLTSIQSFSPFYQVPEWYTMVDSPHLFQPIWSVKWISTENWETCIRLILSAFLISSLAGVLLWSRSRIIRISVFLSFFFYLSLISSFGKIDHYLHLTLIASFLFIFIPNAKSEDPENVTRAKVFFGMQTLILLAYFVSGFFKIYGIIDQEILGVKSALSPDSLAQTISKTSLAANTDYFLQSYILNKPSYLYSALLILGYIIEFFSIYVIFKPRLHRIWGLILVLLHVGILLTVGPDFTNQIFIVGIFLMFSPFANTDTDLINDFLIVYRNIKRKFSTKTKEYIVFYDGECLMCSGFLKFLSKFPLPKEMKISQLQGARFEQLKKEKSGLSEIDSIVVLEIRNNDEEIIRIKANGILWVLSKVNKGFLPVKLLYNIFPFFGNCIYDIVAKYRKKTSPDSCPIPPPEIREILLKE